MRRIAALRRPSPPTPPPLNRRSRADVVRQGGRAEGDHLLPPGRRRGEGGPSRRSCSTTARRPVAHVRAVAVRAQVRTTMWWVGRRPAPAACANFARRTAAVQLVYEQPGLNGSPWRAPARGGVTEEPAETTSRFSDTPPGEAPPRARPARRRDCSSGGARRGTRPDPSCSSWLAREIGCERVGDGGADRLRRNRVPGDASLLFSADSPITRCWLRWPRVTSESLALSACSSGSGRRRGRARR